MSTQPRNRDVGRPGHPTQFASPLPTAPDLAVEGSWRERVAGYGLQQLTPVPVREVEPESVVGWPPAPAEVTHKLTGTLARRVASRLRMEGGRGRTPYLTEWHVIGGSSEWTAEHDIEFDVKLGEKRVTFRPDSESVGGWLEGQHAWTEDSVYARFNDWLRAADDPDGLWAEWFPTPPEVNKWFISYDLAPGTTMAKFLQRRCGPKFDHASLVLVPKDRIEARRNNLTLAEVETSWRLDAVMAADERGFREIRESLGVTPGPTRPTGTVEPPRQEILRVLTNQLHTSGSPQV